ncbi:hypothetical protein Dimus_010984 [Dionaea muscipula]
MSRSTGGKICTIFVEDIPDAMDRAAILRLFVKFGVVRDVFIPRKRSKTGKRFGFVRYNCSVAAEVAIQKTNGVWMHDKELRVKFADYHRNKGKQLLKKANTLASTPGRVTLSA